MARIFLLIVLFTIKTTVSKGWSIININNNCTPIISPNRTITCLNNTTSTKNQPIADHDEIAEIADRILFPNDENSEENNTVELPDERTKEELEASIEDHFNHTAIKGYGDPKHKMSCVLHDGKIPDRFDWREHRKVTGVRNQKNCDACWAFSITATIESHMMIYRSATERLDLSEQLLIDCIKDSPGCNYGSLVQSYSKLVSQLGAMVPEKEYPYVDDQEQCHKHNYYKKLSIAGYKRIVRDEEEMKRHIVQCGPITAAINSKSMKNYNKVVIDEPTEKQCPSNDLDHAVEIVGYDYYRDDETEDKSKQYWIIKNSWGIDFGDSGYYYLVLGRNACGIAQDVTVPLVN